MTTSICSRSKINQVIIDIVFLFVLVTSVYNNLIIIHVTLHSATSVSYEQEQDISSDKSDQSLFKIKMRTTMAALPPGR